MTKNATNNCPGKEQKQTSASIQKFSVQDADEGLRLDSWLSERAGLSRSSIQRLIADGAVTADSRVLASANYRIKAGETVVLALPSLREPHMVPQDIPLEIIFEDDLLLVLNKPAGLVVHPAPGHPDGTLANALKHYLADRVAENQVERQGIVHRLDRDTSGVIVTAKKQDAMEHIQKQFKNNRVGRFYRVLVHGIPDPPQGSVETMIGRSPRNRKRMAVLPSGGRRALTHYRVLELFQSVGAAELEAGLETGRTHQIRVHLRHIGTPVMGDPVYGWTSRDRQIGHASNRQLLHAWRLVLQHPVTGKQMEFEAPLPEDYLHVRQLLRTSA